MVWDCLKIVWDPIIQFFKVKLYFTIPGLLLRDYSLKAKLSHKRIQIGKDTANKLTRVQKKFFIKALMKPIYIAWSIYCFLFCLCILKLIFCLSLYVFLFLKAACQCHQLIVLKMEKLFAFIAALCAFYTGKDSWFSLV